jgi:phosphatidylglycerol lysyltransferase
MGIEVLAENTNSLPRVRELVWEYGWNSTTFQIINPGIKHWFSKTGDAVLGFVRSRGTRVVVGAPVCARERLANVAEEFERDACESGDSVCYFGAEQRLESIYQKDKNHSLLLLGAQPAWSPQNWAEIVSSKSSLRAQFNRAKNKGVRVSEWTSDEATDNAELIGCLQEWLETKGLPPLHFMVETKTLSRLSGRRIFVSEKEKRVMGFVIASPVPQRNGWLIEQNVRAADAPNGTAELQIDSAIRSLAESGADYVTLGLSPLSTHADVKMKSASPLIRFILAWTRAHGKRFYNFNGLDAFKSKFQPEIWEPVYAISNEKRFSLHTLHAIAWAFCGGSVSLTILRAMRHALVTEIRWLFGKR